MRIDGEARRRLPAQQGNSGTVRGGRQQRLPQPPLLDDVGRRLAAADRVVIRHEDRADGVIEA
jgi:hypothetical protein